MRGHHDVCIYLILKKENTHKIREKQLVLDNFNSFTVVSFSDRC